MMKNKLKYIIIFIFLLKSFASYSQTSIAFNFGININNFEYINSAPNLISIDFYERSKSNIGFEFSHYILNDFDVKFGGSYHLKDFSYTIGFRVCAINPYFIYYYKYGNLYLSFGYNIVDWINAGIGIKKMIFYYYQYEDYINGIEEKSTYSNFNMLNFHVNFLYKKFVLSINYNKSFNVNNNSFYINPDGFEILTLNKFDTFEFKLGYRLNIFSQKEKTSK